MISKKAVYAADWSPDGSAIVISEGTKIMTKSLQLRFFTRLSLRYEISCKNLKKPSARHECWNAHAALITALAWGGNDQIVSGSEAGRYKLWDKFGRLLYQSNAISNHPITSASFSPEQNLLIGTFGVIYLCDNSGAIISSISQEWGLAVE